jgi:hypothetical protein
MPADYKLRLGDGTILAVDEAGLRTWLIDAKAMVQPAGSRRWMPLKEVLAQVEAQAAAEARRQQSTPRPGPTPPAPEPPPAPPSPPTVVTPPVAAAVRARPSDTPRRYGVRRWVPAPPPPRSVPDRRRMSAA